MTRRSLAALSVLFALAMVARPLLLAHEGHDHKVMGKVKSIEAKQIEVEDSDGQATWFRVTNDTKIRRGQTPEELAGIEIGERVVVIGRTPKVGEGGATGERAPAQGAAMIAKEIRLAGRAGP